MEGSFSVSFSNRVERLYDFLKARLFSGTAPFARRLVIVPSPAMKEWLMLRLARDPEVGVAAGVEVRYLEEGFSLLYRLFGGEELFPSRLELALKIEEQVRKRLKEPPTPAWEPIFRYLKPPLNRRSERRLSSLSQKLADLFREYGKYGGRMLENFPGGFQKELWEALFSGSWSFPYRAWLSLDPQPLKREAQLHFFAISYLSSLQQQFLMKLSAQLPVRYYLLSPCLAFWSDIRSERESSRLRHYLKKRGIKEAQLQELEEYLRDCNPLLANYGKLGREMARQVENSAPETAESYVVDGEIGKIEAYRELVAGEAVSEKKGAPTLLSTLQSDMLLLRNPDTTPKAPIADGDRSVQVHASASERREIENLYNSLLAIIDKERISPGDIIVMAPDIMQYEPYIKAVFGSGESRLDCQIMDLSVPSQDPAVQGFLHLLSLPETRWEASALLELFECPAFRKKQPFSEEELATVREWVGKGGILWGMDASHRAELLKRDHGGRTPLDKSAAGTWEHGKSRLLAALIYGEEETLETAPAEGVSPSDAELLGRFIALVRELYQSLRPIASGGKRGIAEWAEFLEGLLERYFLREDEKIKKLFVQIFDEMRRAARSVGAAPFPFSTVRRHLKEALDSEQVSYREGHLHAVRFCSLLPMRAIPARAVALIGMNEGAFPRSEGAVSLDLLQSCEEADYCPSRSDYDRYLFLEALLSAREYFILSYVGYSYSDAQALPPSLLVAELLSYIGRSCTLDPEKIVACHPASGFDKRCFTEKNYSERRYKEAIAFYQKERRAPYCFIPSFSLIQEGEPEEVYDLKKLRAFARNPLSTFFNEHLGIYLVRQEERKVRDEENFVLSNLEASLLYKKAATATFEEIVREAERSGKLPFGLFKKSALKKLKAEVEKIKQNLEAAAVDPAGIFEIEFSDRVGAPEKTESGWRLPALSVDGAKIVGKVEQGSRRGLIAHQKKELEHAVKQLPEYLALRLAVRKYSLPVDEEALILTRSEKGAKKAPLTEDPEATFKNLLRLYRISAANPSPLFPKAVETFLSTGPEQLEEKLREKLSAINYNDYLARSVTDENRQTVALHSSQWKREAEKLFSSLYREWYL